MTSKFQVVRHGFIVYEKYYINTAINPIYYVVTAQSSKTVPLASATCTHPPGEGQGGFSCKRSSVFLYLVHKNEQSSRERRWIYISFKVRRHRFSTDYVTAMTGQQLQIKDARYQTATIQASLRICSPDTLICSPQVQDYCSWWVRYYEGSIEVISTEFRTSPSSQSRNVRSLHTGLRFLSDIPKESTGFAMQRYSLYDPTGISQPDLSGPVPQYLLRLTALGFLLAL